MAIEALNLVQFFNLNHAPSAAACFLAPSPKANSIREGQLGQEIGGGGTKKRVTYSHALFSQISRLPSLHLVSSKMLTNLNVVGHRQRN